MIIEKNIQLQALKHAIILEDSRFIMINKPSGMAVHGGSGLSYGVIEALRKLRPTAPYLELAHRLDKDTSGCLVVAKRRSALRAFQREQQSRRVHKHYTTLIQGQWHGGHRKLDVPLLKETSPSGSWLVRADAQGKRAVSYFSPIKSFEEATLMRVKLITGRTHQIRVHAQHMAQPIAGDTKYGSLSFNHALLNLGLTRLFLHASSICFTLPDIDTYDIQAPLTPELAAVLQSL